MQRTYDEWARRHAALFGLNQASDGAMLAAWADIFSGLGFSADELWAASEWIAGHNPPRWRSDHLIALQGRLRDSRTELAAMHGRDQVSYPDCPDCKGSGWVCGLPHLAGLTEGRWDGRYTVGVLCSCAWGQREAQRHEEAKRRSLTLAAYERLNPGWREQMRLEAQCRRELVRASAHAEDRDRLLGPVLRALIGRQQEPA